MVSCFLYLDYFSRATTIISDKNGFVTSFCTIVGILQQSCDISAKKRCGKIIFV